MRRQAAYGMMLAATVLSVVVWSPWDALSFTGTRSSQQWLSMPMPTQDSLVARRVSPYYSNEDRERLSRARRETRIAVRENKGKPSNKARVNLDKLPAIEEIYNRRFTGDGTLDPIGGRNRYTYYVMFKSSTETRADELKQILLEYMYFLKYKMSCRNIEVQARKSPIDTQWVTSLEYPMKEYGELKRDQKEKKMYQKAIMIEFKFYAPVDATEYIQQRFYSDNNILRFMCLSHTRSYTHVGEDNELHL